MLLITSVVLPINDENLPCLSTALNHITKILNGLPLLPAIFGLSYVKIKFSFLNETNMSN